MKDRNCCGDEKNPPGEDRDEDSDEIDSEEDFERENGK